MTSDPLHPGAHREPQAPPARGLRRPLLWALFVIALTANAVTSVSSLPTAVGVTFGVVALALGALLVRDHYRHRARTGGGRPPRNPDA
jgi:Flp pilus assembly protein TadB